MTRLPVLLAAAGLLAAPVLAQSAPAGAPSVTASFKGISGSVRLTAAPKGVLVHLEASGLTPGWHAAHFHEKGDCSDAAFKLSGGHVHGAAPTVHGLLNPAQTDNGDLPNFFVSSDGTAKAEFFTTAVMMATLQDADGAALVVHAKADDYMTQPIGGAGDRVGCALVR